MVRTVVLTVVLTVDGTPTEDQLAALAEVAKTNFGSFGFSDLTEEQGPKTTEVRTLALFFVDGEEPEV